MAINVRIQPATDLSLRDPQDTALGRRILAASVRMLAELGLERFTFKKLAREIGSVEASVYRYFANKHQLLFYLVSWYWDWVHHLVNQASLTASEPRTRLLATIQALTQPYVENPGTPYIDERLLHQVVISEGTKVYHTKMVDEENSRGLFVGYKALAEDISQLILAVAPDFAYPHSLATSLFEMAHNHPYYAEHLPRMTDVRHGEQTSQEVASMLWFWVSRLLQIDSKG